jgi:hypothetical protein
MTNQTQAETPQLSLFVDDSSRHRGRELLPFVARIDLPNVTGELTISAPI